MIEINKEITTTTFCNGAEWEVRYKRKNGIVECTALLYLYNGETLVDTIVQPMPSEIYEEWGTDDMVVQNWLFEQNDITLV